MCKKFKTIQDVIDYTISDVAKWIGNVELFYKGQNKFHNKILKYIYRNKSIIFTDVIYSMYTKYLDMYPADVILNPESETFKTIANLHIYSNGQGLYSENENMDNSDEKITGEKNRIIDNYIACTSNTYNRVQRKIKDNNIPICLNSYKKQNLFGILAYAYSNTEYSKPFSSDLNSINKLYTSLCYLYQKSHNLTTLAKILNDPYNIYMLESIFKTERLYLLYKLSTKKDTFSPEQFDSHTRIFNPLINSDFRLISYTVIDRYFSNNNTINLTFLNNLINYILPNISSIFKKNFINNFEVEDVPDKLIKKIIEIFINHYKYFKKKKLTEANFNKFQSLLNNSIKRKKLRALTSALTFLTFDLFDINKTYEKELTYHKDTLKNYTKQLFELVEKEENLYTNIKFIKLVNKIYKELEIKLDTIYQINSIICDVLIKDNIKELKSKSILYRDNPALSYNKLYQLQTDFEMKSEYEVLCKKIHSITRDKKYKDKTKNIKEFIDFFNTFKTLYDEFEKLKNMLQLKTLYKIKILYDYIHSEDIQNNAIKNYKSIIEKYELFSNAEVYKNIYLPSCIYLYLNPEKRKEFVTDISSNQNQNTVYNIFDIYGKYKLYDLNKNYFKNSKVEYSLDIPYI